MKIYKKAYSFLLFFFLFLTINCTRGVIEPRLSFGSSEARWARKVLSRMTLEEKIGQMICLSYSGCFVNRDSDFVKDLKRLITQQKIGGLILFGGDVYETAYLTNTLQEAAKIPLLISSDLERGLGCQMEGATLFPPLMSIGATGVEESAYQMGKITAQEARAVGINVTYAPVVDVNINPENPIINTRSFGEDPDLVARLGAAFIGGCQENGLMATAKHFPGHGDTNKDSHSVLPSVNCDNERLQKVELFPFKKAIESGVQIIMSAHIWLPAIDPTPNLPSTLSPAIITELLRRKLGFKGIIVTDAMGMGGISSLYIPEEAALRAVQAGVDMILLPPEPEKVIDYLIEGVKKGKVSESRIDSSVRRILEGKARLGLHKNKLVDIEAIDKKVATKENLNVAAEMFEDSITLVKNEKNLIPLSSEQRIAVFSLSSDPGDFFAGKVFVEEIRKRCPEGFDFFADKFTGQEFINEAMEKICDADIIVIALFSRLRGGKGSVDLDLRHIELIKKLSESSKPMAVISFGSPYFLKHFPQIDSYLCAYRYASEAQEAAAEAIFGEIDIKGRLPVSIPDMYPVGHGIRLYEELK